MKIKFSAVAALFACMLAGAALAVSLMHSGPAGRTGPPGPTGPAGPQGNPGKSAQQSRFGICWVQNIQDSGGVVYVSGMSIDPAQIVSGVYQCPQGETFVSIVPAPASTPTP